MATKSFYTDPDVKASSLSTTLTTNIKGNSKSKDINGKAYPKGITPEVDYYINPDNVNPNTNSPEERGILLNGGILVGGQTKYGELRNTNDIYNDISKAYNAFDNKESEEFRHHLDQDSIPFGVQLNRYNDVYLSSFVETDTDNEDPVSFSYDIIIDYDNSPLFNGAIEQFINNYPNYTELNSRLEVIKEFKINFFKFFKINSTNIYLNDSKNLNISRQSTAARTYYIKKLSGLDNLTENINSDKPKQFVDYGKDFLTLSLYEDVSINMGYLTTLYKTLSWSRVHGKSMIPANLLRFDLELVITEAKNYNRVIKANNMLEQYADITSRYRYKIYECQFFFDKMSHGDSIDMSSVVIMDSFDLRFNYKYSTMKFEKFKNSNTTDGIRSHKSVDNSKINLNSIDSKDTNNAAIVNNTIVLSPMSYNLKKYSKYSAITNMEYNQNNNASDNYVKNGETVNSTADIIRKASIKDENEYQKKVNNAYISKHTNSVSKQTTLLQKTLQNIEASIGAGIKRSIYELKKDITDFIPKNFIGGFTEDGYQYNVPAYYINKAFNTLNNTLKKSLGTVRRDIYEQKNVYVQTQLSVINKTRNIYNNQINHLVADFVPNLLGKKHH